MLLWWTQPQASSSSEAGETRSSKRKASEEMVEEETSAKHQAMTKESWKDVPQPDEGRQQQLWQETSMSNDLKAEQRKRAAKIVAALPVPEKALIQLANHPRSSWPLADLYPIYLETLEGVEARPEILGYML
eukprot:Gb_39292 [translate_table: standard]